MEIQSLVDYDTYQPFFSFIGEKTSMFKTHFFYCLKNSNVWLLQMLNSKIMKEILHHIHHFEHFLFRKHPILLIIGFMIFSIGCFTIMYYFLKSKLLVQDTKIASILKNHFHQIKKEVSQKEMTFERLLRQANSLCSMESFSEIGTDLGTESSVRRSKRLQMNGFSLEKKI